MFWMHISLVLVHHFERHKYQCVHNRFKNTWCTGNFAFALFAMVQDLGEVRQNADNVVKYTFGSNHCYGLKHNGRIVVHHTELMWLYWDLFPTLREHFNICAIAAFKAAIVETSDHVTGVYIRNIEIKRKQKQKLASGGFDS
jgi:hypothetical protein